MAAFPFRIDIDQVENSLREVQRDFHKINDSLDMRREHLADEIIENMVAGYEYVNYLLDKDVNLLRRSGYTHYLELNHIVLCGRGRRNRKNYQGHIATTTDRFYGHKPFSIKHMRLWDLSHTKKSAWHRAAGAYILQISRPQLFLEGNHRTGALMMSSLLVRKGKPPFVMSIKNAKAYLDPSSLAKSTEKNIWGRYYKLPKIKKRFANFLKEQAREEFLRPSILKTQRCS